MDTKIGKAVHMKKRIVKFDYRLFEKYAKEKNVDSKKICKYLGLSGYTVSRWRNGKVEPRSVTLYMIANLLDVPMEKFFIDEYIDVPDDMDEYVKQARYENPFENAKMYDSLVDTIDPFKLEEGKQKVNYVIPFKNSKKQ